MGELGDAGGTLLVGAVGALTLAGGFMALGFVLALAAAVTARAPRPPVEAEAD